MLDHVSLRVQDFGKAVEFYRAALAPIGYTVVMELEGAAGMGAGGKPDLWLMQTDKTLNPTHLALVSTRDRVDAFHAAALAAGGTDNGAPGLRPDYHPHYYGAFIYDPEGNNIEVVCHDAPGGSPEAAPRKAAARKSPKPTKSTKSSTSAKSSAPSAKASAKPSGMGMGMGKGKGKGKAQNKKSASAGKSKTAPLGGRGAGKNRPKKRR